ncbi:MAG TPA: isocitrate lyase/phosphoenolpyruvate mutase family protein [Chitinophagaceae bacterium]
MPARYKPGDHQKKVETLRRLHYREELLVLPNIWDPIGALLLEDLGFPCVATASAAIAYSNGMDDGEHISFDELLAILRRITDSVSIPVTADIETGFADNDQQLRQNIVALIDTGVAGINIEDRDPATDSLINAEQHAERIHLIKETTAAAGTDIFVNARCDVYVRGRDFPDPASKLHEAGRRLKIYEKAGADCFYPITLTNEKHIELLVESSRIPINVLAMPGLPDLSKLKALGIARVSLGPGFLKIAVRAMRDLAIQLKSNKGLDEIAGNDVTSAYLKQLVNGSDGRRQQ